MKKFLFAVLPVAAISLLTITTPNEPLPIGSAIPKADTRLKDVSGQEITLKSAVKENGLLVMFSCNTCPVVIRHQDRTKDIAKYAIDNKIGVVLLNSNENNRKAADSYEAMKTYAKEQGYTWSYAVDENNMLADAFGAQVTPESFLFDKNGKLVYHGSVDNNQDNANPGENKYLKNAIDNSLKGKPSDPAEAKGKGCGIKRLKA